MQINAVYGFGSTGIIAKDLYDISRQDNIYSIVVCQVASTINKDIYQMGNKIDWKLHAFLTRVLGKQAYASVVATKKLLHYLDKEKPDIIHLHNLHANYVNLNMLLKYLAEKNIAVVITLHDCWFFTGKCFHFVDCGCAKWKTGCGNCPQNKEDVKSLFFDRTSSVFEDKKKYFQAISNLTVVGCSDWIKGLAEQSPIFQGKHITRIYNGVDTSIFYLRQQTNFRKVNQFEGKFIILGMANKWMKSENAELVRKLFNKLKEDEQVVIVGCSEQQKSELENYQRVLAVGFVRDRNILADIYSASDVFVNMTYEDTLPTVNMESICCGTPVITFDSCGSPELVHEGVTGYVISQGSESELLNALHKVKNRLIDRKQCAGEGKRWFDKNQQYKEYLALYRNIENRGKLR